MTASSDEDEVTGAASGAASSDEDEVIGAASGAASPVRRSDITAGGVVRAIVRPIWLAATAIAIVLGLAIGIPWLVNLLW